jgi:hypothetical protein
MKLLTTIIALSFALGLASSSTFAQDKKASPKEEKHDHDHDHDHAKKAGPTGGKLITEVEPHVEFFVNKEKKVEIRFVDDDNKVVAIKDQVITATLGDRSKPTKLTFTKDGDKLVSDVKVPDGNDYPTVVTDAKAKAVNAKFNLNMTKCPSCPNPEYSCTCDHDHDGHDHKDGEKHDHEKEGKDAKKGK